MVKQAWTQHLQVVEAATGADQGLQQDLRQLRAGAFLSPDKDTGRWSGPHTGGRWRVFFVRDVSGSKTQCNPACKRRASEVGGARPLGIFWKNPDSERWSLKSPT